jgi:hypothetical protein
MDPPEPFYRHHDCLKPSKKKKRAPARYRATPRIMMEIRDIPH